MMAQDGLTLIAHAFARDRDNFLHEDPCYQGARFAFQGFGYRTTAVPIDQHGIEVEQLPETPRSLLYVTPSHQYPIGMTLPLERRLALLDWAERTDSLIIEDDYDGEFRYEGAPLTALRGLDEAGRVLYLGTFSKSFGPGLRLGYIIASRKAICILRDWKQLCSNGSPWLEQAAMAEFMSVGGFRRHLRRIRAIYMRHRNHLLMGYAAVEEKRIQQAIARLADCRYR